MPSRSRPSAALVLFSLALAALAALPPTAARAAAPASAWQQTGPMGDRHVQAAVATLPGGGVLVAGGYRDNPGNPLASVERYDPTTGAWRAAAPLAGTRHAARAVALRDGRVLVIGGIAAASTVTASSELYDPATDAWTPAAPMAVPRFAHTATLLDDGTVLVAGGYSQASTPYASAERYDPETDTWTPAGTLPSPHGDHSATRMDDGSVVVAGGSASFSTHSADVARFDPASGTWAALPPLPDARSRHTAVLLADGALLIAGGSVAGGSAAGLLRLGADGAGWEALPVGGVLGMLPGLLRLPSGPVLIVTNDETLLFEPRSGQLARAGAPTMNVLGGTLVPLADGTVMHVGGVGGATQSAGLFTPLAAALTAPVDFGEQTTGRRGPVLSVPITTAGDVPIFPRAVALEGSDAGDFEVVSDTCSGGAVERRQACFVGVRFTPRAVGARSASLVLSAGELAGGRHVVALGGTGVAAPITVAPAPAPAPAPPRAEGRRPTARRTADSRLRCGARRGRAVVCTGVPRTLGSGRARLSRGGIVHATGRLKNGRLTLTVRRRLFDRRYTLVVGGRRPVKVVLD